MSPAIGSITSDFYFPREIFVNGFQVPKYGVGFRTCGILSNVSDVGETALETG